jgi:hypothetical protein
MERYATNKNCGKLGGDERCIYNFSRETWREETIIREIYVI